jgi:hypothetical protein
VRLRVIEGLIGADGSEREAAGFWKQDLAR